MCYDVPHKRPDFDDVWPWNLTLRDDFVLFQYFSCGVRNINAHSSAADPRFPNYSSVDCKFIIYSPSVHFPSLSLPFYPFPSIPYITLSPLASLFPFPLFFTHFATVSLSNFSTVVLFTLSMASTAALLSISNSLKPNSSIIMLLLGYTWSFRSNLHFKFLTLGHSGAQHWAPECPSVRNLKW